MRFKILFALALCTLAVPCACDDEEADADADTDLDTDGELDADTDRDRDLEVDLDREADADVEQADCDVISGGGCDAGEKCAFYSRDGERWHIGCVPTPADVAGPGERCTSVPDAHFGVYDNCEAGYQCLSQVGSDEFACAKLCSLLDPGPCQDAYVDPSGERSVDGLCTSSLEGDLPLAGLMVCLPPSTCSPICQDCPSEAASRTACYRVSDGINVGNLCVPFDRGDLPGAGAASDPCEFLDNCAPGHHCLERVCHPYCDRRIPTTDGDADADADSDAEEDAGDGDACPFSTCSASGAACTTPPTEPEGLFADGLGLCLD